MGTVPPFHRNPCAPADLCRLRSYPIILVKRLQDWVWIRGICYTVSYGSARSFPLLVHFPLGQMGLKVLYCLTALVPVSSLVYLSLGDREGLFDFWKRAPMCFQSLTSVLLCWQWDVFCFGSVSDKRCLCLWLCSSQGSFPCSCVAMLSLAWPVRIRWVWSLSAWVLSPGPFCSCTKHSKLLQRLGQVA